MNGSAEQPTSEKSAIDWPWLRRATSVEVDQVLHKTSDRGRIEAPAYTPCSAYVCDVVR